MTTLLGPERWARARALFDAAAALAPDARGPYLDDACDDAGVRAEVDALLACDLPDDASLDAGIRRAIVDTAADAVATAATPPERIGPYRVISHIGDGGMGAVYLAERDGDAGAPVAIKMIRGVAAEDGLRRFRDERRVLATLQHPSIARLLDGDATAEGLPYIAMEYVQGAAIDEYCRSERLSLRERVTLMRRVCDAVSHAHRSLVIHRDIKPSNILVTADGTPKLLDFGIARLLDGGAGEPELPRPGQMLTPEYASPEQVRGEAVTTATDVYSLGVLLYELLTGTRLFDFASRRSDEILRSVCGGTVPKPSVAAARWPRLSRALSGDLDAIVLTALDKDPARRYASVADFADDLLRFLEHRPVRARPATAAYRARRFVRRHRTATATAALFAIVLVGFGAALAGSWRRAARERAAAERVTAVLVRMFGRPGPQGPGSSPPAARELLDRGVGEIRSDLREQPALQARLFEAAGTIYAGLGLYDRAQAVLRDAVTARAAAGAADSLESARTMWRLADALRDRERYADAEPLARTAHDMTARMLGPRNQLTAQTLVTLGMIVHAQGRHDEAAPMFQQATAVFRETLGRDHPMVATALLNTAISLRDQGDLPTAEATAREALTLCRQMFAPALVDSLSLLAQVADRAGRGTDATALRQEAASVISGA